MFLLLIAIDFSAIVASQLFSATPPIMDGKGGSSDGSIAVMEQVELNGSKQWITIRGKNAKNPLLLYLGIGGPGAGGFPATAMNLKPLEDHFTVVNWDQPGTGKSYNARPIKSLTVKQFVDDARALTILMRHRFKQDRVYVLGLSWGSIVGINLVKEYPELYKAYIGTGQMVNTVENDRYGYGLALKYAEEKGDKATLNKLLSNGPPPYKGAGMGLKFALYNDVLFQHMGSPTVPLIMVIAPQFAKEYGYVDKVNFGRGLFESFTHIYPQLEDLDFISQAPRLEIPVYFLVGRRDINAVAAIVERYYNVLEAPHKELIWLGSGHGATAEEIENALVNRVLKTAP